ncbi:MAG: hypothetical protein QXH07_05850 [Thermoplasmata archaeon]
MAKLCVCEDNKIVFTLTGKNTSISTKKATAILKAILPIISNKISDIQDAINFWSEHIEHMKNVDEKKVLEEEKVNLENVGKTLSKKDQELLNKIKDIKHGRPVIYEAVAIAMVSYIEPKVSAYIEQYKKENPTVEERYIIIPRRLTRLSFEDRDLIFHIEKQVPLILEYQHSKSRYKVTRRVFYKAKKILSEI